MLVLLLVSVISAASVTFLVWFFTALQNEIPARTCCVVRISPSSMQRTSEVSPLRATSTMLLHRASTVLR